MKICTARGINLHLARHAKIISLETGKQIRDVFYVDDHRGNLGRYVRDEQGDMIMEDDEFKVEFLTDQLIRIDLDKEGQRKLQEYGEIPKPEERYGDELN